MPEELIKKFVLHVYANFYYFPLMKIKLLFYFLFAIQSVYSQEKESFYVFDADWKPTDVKSAKFILHVQNLNDSSWQWDYYNMFGPLIKTEHYKNKDGQILHGSVAYYNANGFLDSTGSYANGKKEGDFVKYSEDSLEWLWEYKYHDDKLVEIIDAKKTDDLPYNSDPLEIESFYPGGIEEWQKYLYKNFKYPDRAINNNIEGEVRVLFIVNNDGAIEDPYLSKSVEYSLDEEALRIIKHSGKWIPAVKDGSKVKSVKSQPIAFKLK